MTHPTRRWRIPAPFFPPPPVRVRYSVFLSASLALPTRAHRFAGHTSNYTQLKPLRCPPSIASPIRALFFLPDENACSSERHRDAGHVMPARPPESEPALPALACPHRRGPDNSLPDHPSPIHHVANLLPSPQARATRSSLILRPLAAQPDAHAFVHPGSRPPCLIYCTYHMSTTADMGRGRGLVSR